MIAKRSQRRLLNFAGVLAVIGLMSYALYEQWVVGLDACPLCIFQRMGMIALGVVFLAAGLHAPAGRSARFYAALGAIVALVGAGISSWHLHEQSLPAGVLASCGPGLDYMRANFPLHQVLKWVFTSSGQCSQVNWTFLGLAMPGWVLIWFALLGGLVVYANWTPVADAKRAAEHASAPA